MRAAPSTCRPFRKAITDFTEPRGIVTIGLDVYDQQLFTFKTPVDQARRFLRQARPRAGVGGRAGRRCVALGASAVPMSLPEVLPAVQQGTIDGANSVLGAFVAFRYYDAAPNLLDTGLWALMPVSLVSKMWFSRLPADLQKAVRRDRPRDRARDPQVADPAHRGRLEDLEGEGRQGRQAVRRRAGGGDEARLAAVQAVLAKNPSSKELYDKLKAAADSVN